jgi:uncharacterized protein (TIGR02231 family)
MVRAMNFGGVLGSALLAASGPAFAADLEAASRIASVVVYPDGASVTRTAHVTLPAGATTLMLRGLGPTVDPGSIRVEASADAALSIGSVDVRTAAADPAAADPAIDVQLKALRQQRVDLTTRISVLDAKRQSIETYGKASPEKLGPGAAPLAVDQWPAIWDTVARALGDVGQALNERNRELADLDARINALQQARPRAPRPGAPLRDVAIAVEAATALTGDVTVTYRVAGASWLPVYDARLDTGSKDTKPSLALVRRARIVQRTGEDWADVALSVSTVRASRGTAAPDARSLLVGLLEPPIVYESMARPAPASPALAPLAGTEAGKDGVADLAARKAAPAREQVAQLESGGYQATFVVPGRASVPPDGSAKVVALSSRSSEPVLAVKAVPVQDETAYLEAAFINEEDAPLLPGDVALTRDGTYVGRGRLKLVAPGDRVELGFGADDRVKVSRVAVRKRETEPGWVGNTRTDQRDFKTVVRNLHATPLRITILDALPVSEHASVVVDQLPATTAPTDKSVGDKRGIMGWTWDYLPGEQKEIHLAYRLKWPADRDLSFHPQQPVPLSE